MGNPLCSTRSAYALLLAIILGLFSVCTATDPVISKIKQACKINLKNIDPITQAMAYMLYLKTGEYTKLSSLQSVYFGRIMLIRALPTYIEALCLVIVTLSYKSWVIFYPSDFLSRFIAPRFFQTFYAGVPPETAISALLSLTFTALNDIRSSVST